MVPLMPGIRDAVQEHDRLANFDVVEAHGFLIAGGVHEVVRERHTVECLCVAVVVAEPGLYVSEEAYRAARSSLARSSRSLRALGESRCTAVVSMARQAQRRCRMWRAAPGPNAREMTRG